MNETKSKFEFDPRFTVGDVSRDEADFRMAVAAQRLREREALVLAEIRWRQTLKTSNT